MRRNAGRETWHRLIEWDQSDGDAERLAALLLSLDGFSGVDPSHPLGGRDGKRDLIMTKDGALWIGAVYFPRGQKKYSEIEAKFLSDAKAIRTNNASGLAFITNQELRLSEREKLKESVECICEIYHLERISQILNQPKGYGIRLDFLQIELSKEEQIAILAFKDEIIEKLIKQLESKHVIDINSPKGEPITVMPEPVNNWSFASYGFGPKLHFCSQCGFGYKVADNRYTTAILSAASPYSITCPKCSNTEYYNKPLI